MLATFSGCKYDDTDVQDRLGNLENKVTEIEALVKTINSQIGTLQSLINGKLFITGVTENSDGKGYTLSLVSDTGTVSTIVIEDGEDGQKGDDGATPNLGVKQDSDGKYYWTIDGEFIVADGKKMPVSGEDGVTPEFKVENSTLYVSYGDGEWTSCGALFDLGALALIKDVALSEDGRYVMLTLVDGSVVTFELYKEFGIAFDTMSDALQPGQTVDIPFVLTGANENTVVEAIAQGNWKAEVTMEGTTGGTVTVTAPEDFVTGRVIVLANDGGTKTVMKTLTFLKGVMNVSTQSQEVLSVGGTLKFELQTDLEYDVVIPEEDQSWISVADTRSEVRDETLTFTVAANSLGEERSSLIELNSNGVVVETLLIYQYPHFDPAAFVVKVVPVAADKTVSLPFDGTVDVTIDWGDGSEVETVTAPAPTHAYAEEGEYVVVVKGAVSRLNNIKVNYKYRSTVTEVMQWGQLGLTSLEGAFDSNKGLVSVVAPEEDAFANVTTTESMFDSCAALEAIPAGLLDQCTLNESAASMFYGCKLLTSIPAGFFDSCSKITSLKSTFSGCEALAEVPAGLFNNLTAVTDISSLFLNCDALGTIPAGLFDSMTEVTAMSSLFSNCVALKTIPDGLFDSMTKVTTMSGLFSGCTSLSSVPENLFKSQTEVTGAGTLFKNCSSLASIPAGTLDSFTKVTNMGSIFSGCASLENLPSGLFDKVGTAMADGSKLDISYLYDGCAKMTEFPALPNVAIKNVASMWKGCTSMTTVPANYFPDDCSSAISIANMFNGCTSLQTLPAGLFDGFTGITSSLSVFSGCTSLQTLPEGLFDDITKANTIKEMFLNCTSLTSVPVGLFNSMTQIKTFDSAFEGCTNFTGESPYSMIDTPDGQVKVHLYEREDYPDSFTTPTSYDDVFVGCEKMADYTMIPIDWGGISDGTMAAPTATITSAKPEGEEYYALSFNVKGTEFVSGKYAFGTKTAMDEALAQFDGDMTKVCNRYGASFTSSQLAALMSESGITLDASDLDASTEYSLLVVGTNVHGTCSERHDAATDAWPQGEANYERYVGTWTVTTTSSEVTQKPQTYTIQIEPYRVNESYRIYDWGITTLGSKENEAPIIMTYNTDGTVGINMYDELGMYGLYYIYSRYRFFDSSDSFYKIWISQETLVNGAYGDNGFTLTCGTFNNGTEQQVLGFDYVLYYSGSYYESKDLFKPGYLIDDSKADYGVGPYTLTKAVTTTTSSRQLQKTEVKFLNEKLQPSKSENLVKNLPIGAYGLKMISVR